MEIDRAFVRKVEADINAALVEVAQKHGLSSLKCAGGSLSSENFILKVEGVVSGGLDELATRYEDNHVRMHLPALGSSFDWGGKPYVIVGMTRGWSVLAKGPTGKTYRFQPKAINPVKVEVKEFKIAGKFVD